MSRALLAFVALAAIVVLRPPASVTGQEAQPPLTLEFDARADFDAIEGLRVGYFRPDTNVPIRVVDVPRNAVIVTGKVMRVSVPRLAIEGSGVVVLRLQVVSKSRGLSDWSDPTDRVTMPVIPVPERRPAPERRPRPALSAAALDAHPALKAEFITRLGPNGSVDDALKGFRRVQDVAVAVIVSRQQEIPFDRLCRLLVGPPRASLRQAIRRLKPSLNPRDAIRSAQVESRALLGSLAPRP